MPIAIAKKIIVAALVSLPSAVVAQPNHPISHDEIIRMLEDHKAEHYAHGPDLRPVVDDLESRVARAESRISEAESRVSIADDAIQALGQAREPTPSVEGPSRIETLVLSALAGTGAAVATWFAARAIRRRKPRPPDETDHGQADPDPAEPTSTEQTNEGERLMFRKLEIRDRGRRGCTGYAIVRSKDIIEELEEALEKARANPNAYRIQLRAGNQEPVATGLDDYRSADDAWQHLENIHDNTLDGQVARIDDS